MSARLIPALRHPSQQTPAPAFDYFVWNVCTCYRYLYLLKVRLKIFEIDAKKRIEIANLLRQYRSLQNVKQH